MISDLAQRLSESLLIDRLVGTLRDLAGPSPGTYDVYGSNDRFAKMIEPSGSVGYCGVKAGVPSTIKNLPSFVRANLSFLAR